MTLRRGFKTEANEIALSIRTELGLAASAPLNPWLVAELLDVPVLGMRSFANEVPTAVLHFSHEAQASFSGVPVFAGTRRIIVYNDSHSLGRRANDVSHEVAHALLLHSPTPAMNDLGCRLWDGEIEEEADYLGRALLVPQEAALSIVGMKVAPQDAAREYGVSRKMIDYRVRITGARLRVARGERFTF
jgi:Zn-dependent peptidase ImmA (M78 family)